MKLVIDLRRAFESGLGTYIRHVVPATVSLLTNAPATTPNKAAFELEAVGLIAPGDDDRHRAYWGQVPVRFQSLRAAPLSVAEQWALRLTCGDDAVFWATTLSHALWAPQRVVATVHDVAQLALPTSAGNPVSVRWASRAFFANLQRRAELLLFNSHFTASEFARYVGTARGRTAVTPLGVDCHHWQSAPENTGARWAALLRDAPYFVCLGNLRPHKNLPLLLEALEGVASVVPHHLVVVGRAMAGSSPEQALGRLPPALAGRVHLLGEVAAAALPGLLQRAAALVMPSLYEGFGLPVLEAFAAGCPVLASRIGALQEVGADAAIYFDPADQPALSKLLVWVAGLSQTERNERVQAGRARAAVMPWQHTTSLTVQAWRSVLQGPQTSPPQTNTIHGTNSF
jgi:glycosyltransferase involved in cell wall biosynthesis